MLERIRAAARQEEGATAVEYGLIVAAIAALIVLVVLVLGRQVQEGFCDTSSALSQSSSITTTAGAACP